MIRITPPVPVRTRLPKEAWIFALLATLSSLFWSGIGFDPSEPYFRVAELAIQRAAAVF
jgi:hypothetical protein